MLSSVRGLQGKSAFVTGAAGFIGANLTRELLDQGATVHAMVRPGGNLVRISELLPRLRLHEVDLNDGDELAETIRGIEPDMIFNLASSGGHPSTPLARFQFLKTNVLGTFNLLEAVAPIEFEHFVHFGSSLEYGSRGTPLRETLRLEPSTFRGVSKASAALLCQQFAHTHQKPLVLIRPFSVYGYWEAPTRLIPTAVMAALRGREMELTTPGFSRDPIFVDDLVEASLLTLGVKKAYGKVINVGSGRQWSNEQIVELIQSIAGREIELHVGAHPPSPSDTQNWVADISRARRYLGWQPKHSLRAGLEKTIAWIRTHLDVYDDWIATLSQ